MIVWLASYPRSGNTFLRIVLHEVFGCRSMSVYADEAAVIRAEGTRGRPYAIALDRSLDELAASREPFFVKTHDLPGSDGGRAIYLVRDGRDALVSYAWYVLEFEEGVPPEEVSSERFDATLSRLIDDRRSPFGTWSTHVLAWRERPSVEMIRFEDLVQGPRCVEAALTGLGLPLPARPNSAPPTFEYLHRLRPAFFRRGVTGSWRDEFPPTLLPRFEATHGGVLRELGYDR